MGFAILILLNSKTGAHTWPQQVQLQNGLQASSSCGLWLPVADTAAGTVAVHSSASEQGMAGNSKMYKEKSMASSFMGQKYSFSGG